MSQGVSIISSADEADVRAIPENPVSISLWRMICCVCSVLNV